MTGPAFEVRELALPPGAERAYDGGEWRDALVFVERGEIELESLGGRRRRFQRGAILWLAGLSLRSLRNRGRETAVLFAVTRRRPRRENVRKTAPSGAGARATVNGVAPSPATDESRRRRQSSVADRGRRG
jgi:glyoxylate utilization-related uncharacterized protein